MTRVPAPDTERFLAYVMQTLEDLEALEYELKNFTKGGEGAATLIIAEMNKLTGELDRASKKWVGSEMPAIYRRAFDVHGAGRKIPSDVLARNAKERKATLAKFRRANADIRRWSAARGKDLAIAAETKKLVDRLERERKLLSKATGFEKKVLGSSVVQLENKIRNQPKPSRFTPQPNVIYRSRGGKATAYRSADEYYRMATQSAYSRMNNLGVLEGAPDDAYFLVSDGPSCGWESHDDQGKFNGQIVTKKFALTRPIAHPYCQRTFTLADGPPGSRKAHKQLKELFGRSDKRFLTKLIEAGPVIDKGYDNFKMAMRVISVAKNSNISKMLVRQIEIDNPGTLPDFVTRQLRIWENGWSNQEQKYLQRAGSFTGEGPGVDHSFQVVEHMNQSVFTKEFSDLGYVDEVKLPEEFRLLFNFKPTQRVSKAQVLERSEDYADFVAHRRAGQMIQKERLINNGLSAEAQDFTLAAMRGNFSAPRGFGSLKKMAHSYESAVKLARENRERLTYELVRELAGQMDVLPWWRTQWGPVRIGAGINAQGRRRLAGDLYKNLRDAKAYSRDDILWTRSVGLHLPDRSLSLQDVFYATQPRVSFLGKNVYYTVALENGRLAPIFRVHPQGAIVRHLGLTANLAKRTPEGARLGPRDYVNAIRSDYDKGGAQEVLRKLSQESLYTIDVFRQSPVQASFKLTGRHLDNWSIHSHPDSPWIGAVWRLFGKQFVEMSEAERDTLLREMIEKGMTPKDARRIVGLLELPKNYQDNLFPGVYDRRIQRLTEEIRNAQPFSDRADQLLIELERAKAAAKARDVKVTINMALKMATRYEDRLWTPRMKSAVGIPGNFKAPITRTMIQLYAWHGDLTETARALNIGLADVVRTYYRFPDLFKSALREMRKQLSLSEMQANLDALEAILERGVKDAKIELKIEKDILAMRIKLQRQHLSRRIQFYKDKAGESWLGEIWYDAKKFDEEFGTNFADEALAKWNMEDHGDLNFSQVQGQFSLAKVDKGYTKDVRDFYRQWSVIMEGVDESARPVIEMGEGLMLSPWQADGSWIPGVTAFGTAPDGTFINGIIFHYSAAIGWTKDLQNFITAGYNAGHFAIQKPIGMIWHEAGHWITFQMIHNDPDLYIKLWENVARFYEPTVQLKARWWWTDGWETMNDVQRMEHIENSIWWNLVNEHEDLMSSTISLYGSSSPREFIAEAFGQFLTDSAPSGISQVIGRDLVKAMQTIHPRRA